MLIIIKMTDICAQVVTIPQADNTNVCWFNAIIMALLYSQNSRNLLLSSENALSKRRDKISKILHQILTRQFMKNNFVSPQEYVYEFGKYEQK